MLQAIKNWFYTWYLAFASAFVLMKLGGCVFGVQRTHTKLKKSVKGKAGCNVVDVIGNLRGCSVDAYVLDVCDKRKGATAIINAENPEEEKISYGEIAQLSRAVSVCLAQRLAATKLAKDEAPTSSTAKAGSGANVTSAQRVVGLMVENCVEYYALTCGISGASNHLNSWSSRFQGDNTDPNSVGGDGQRFHNVCGALINTNCPSNDALCQSLSCVKCPLLIIEGKFLPLLFYEGEVKLPSCVEKVLVWGHTPNGINLRDFHKASAELVLFQEEVREMVASPIQGKNEVVSVEVALARARAFELTDPYVMIYTSGTTGLPKAAKFSHMRVVGGRALSQTNVAPKPTNGVVTLYTVLPMYHSAAGIFGLTLLFGGKYPTRMVLRKKLSASRIKKDIEDFKVDILQYIGEILRYAVSAVRKTNEAAGGDATTLAPKHQIQIAFGNGCRPDVWLEAQKVLNIAKIVEFYASTEGNVGSINPFNEPFAIGHQPVFPWPFTRFSPIFLPPYPIKMVDHDTTTEAPFRDPKTGYVKLSAVGSVGELLGQVQVGHDPVGLRRFEGYLNDKEGTNKKILRGAFKKDDLFFRTGDLVKMDSRGFMYFVDRVGDTFRWKGENVSTLDVAQTLNSVQVEMPDGAKVVVQDSVVFGVPLPGMDGKAGMAKVILKDGDLPVNSVAEEVIMERHLFAELSHPKSKSRLPSYAIPLFLRVDPEPAPEVLPRVNSAVGKQNIGKQPEASTEGDETGVSTTTEITGTFKYRKVGLQKEGFAGPFLAEEGEDSEEVPRIYYLATLTQEQQRDLGTIETKAYRRLSNAKIQSILDGKGL